MPRKSREPVPGYLTHYSPAQLKVILENHPIKQVVAAAGSGKTRTVVGLIEHRLRSGLENRVLLLSFSRRAVGELRERLPRVLRSQVEISTFHSFCFRWLSRLDPQYRDGGGIQLISEEEKRAVLYGILANPDNDPALDVGGIPFDLLLKEPKRFRAVFPEAALRVFRGYHVYKRENGRLEYDDLVQAMLNGLRADQIHLASLRTRYGLIVVDEFQDTDPTQLEFLRLMNPPRLVVVGDDWQAIYAFRGATVGPFLSFRQHFPNARIYHLSENYRSLRPIVTLGNHMIKASRRQIPKRVQAIRGSGPGFPLLAFPMQPGNESGLSDQIAAGQNREDCKILVRTNNRRRRWLEAGFLEEQVLTIHKAKGLEFPIVLLDLLGGWSEAGASGGKRPDDEEIRVLYVGGSRAQELLVVLHDPDARSDSREAWFWRNLLAARCRPADLRNLEKWLNAVQIYRNGQAQHIGGGGQPDKPGTTI